MKALAGMVGALAFVAMVATAMPVQAEKASRLTCPKGWSFIGQVCVSDRTGDVESAHKQVTQTGSHRR